MKKPIRLTLSLKKLLRDQRGATAIIFTIYLPVILGFYTLATDMAYVYEMRNQLQATADAAALAGSTDLANACSLAKSYATKNMATATYGNVLKQNSSDCSDVVIGTWSCAAGQTCTAANFASNATAPCGSACNAVQVTTRTSTANGNPLNLFFAPMIGLTSFNVSATAIATYGGPGSQAWNVMIAQDVSQSFTDSGQCPNCLTNAKAADKALLNCVNQNAGTGSKFGVDLLTGKSTSGAPYLDATTSNNFKTLSDDIDKIKGCGNTGAPACSGTNFSPAITDAAGQLCPAGSICSTGSATGPRYSIVLVTDGLPNCEGMKGGDTACKNAAITAVNNAAAQGTDVFVIYYGTNSSDANWLQTLPRGNGFYLNAPTADDIVKRMQQVCSSQPHRLVY